MKYNPVTVAAVLAMALSLVLSARIYSQNNGFNKTVNESLASSEGYDQQFINLVNHLEVTLARRASFAYPGGKDPMTGRRREVASEPEVLQTRRPLATTKLTSASKSSRKQPSHDTPDSTKTPAPVDHVKLTAIIADDYGQHTAIVMDGERSQSVDVGDLVSDRKVLKITAKEITMENDFEIFTYDLAGNRTYQHK